MNHILKNTSADQTENMASYKNPELPLKKELIPKLVNFIKNSPK